jgi:hypothetical protein
MFMFHFDESFWFEFKCVFVDVFVAVDDGDGDPECTSFGEEVFLSDGSESAIFETETEGPYGGFEAENFREEGEEDGVFFHGEDVEGLRCDFCGGGVFDVEGYAFADHFEILWFGECNDDVPESGGKGVCLLLTKEFREYTPRTKINCNMPLANALVVGSYPYLRWIYC